MNNSDDVCHSWNSVYRRDSSKGEVKKERHTRDIITQCCILSHEGLDTLKSRMYWRAVRDFQKNPTKHKEKNDTSYSLTYLHYYVVYKLSLYGPVLTETFTCVFVLFTVLKGIENNQLIT